MPVRSTSQSGEARGGAFPKRGRRRKKRNSENGWRRQRRPTREAHVTEGELKVAGSSPRRLFEKIIGDFS
ncbi:hypothetical protein MHYP_G00266490 [Metynnis hypsauchen]